MLKENYNPKTLKIKVNKSDVSSKEARELNDRIQEKSRAGKDPAKEIRELNEKYSIQKFETTNKLPLDGRKLIPLAWNNDVNDLFVNYAAVGTDSTAAADGDTQLDSEIFRRGIASHTTGSGSDADKFYPTAFFGAEDFSGTVEEVGLFIQGTDSANSGYLFSRFASPDTVELPVTKSSTETLSCEYTITTMSSN